MIQAEHKKWAHFVFKPYIMRLLKRDFHSIHLIGDIPQIDSEQQIILTPNHSTWWDGFFVYLLNEKFFQRTFYIMILEEQLAKYSFFSKLGGFSIKHNSPKKIIESLRYCSELLEGNKPVIVTIFPQGELLPSFIRPISSNPGIAKLIGMVNRKTVVLPLAIRIEYLNEEKPQLFFKFGKATDIIQNEKNLGELIENELDFIGNSILSNEFGKVILTGKKSISEKSTKLANLFKKSN
ncbi:MAG: lysophospholipid acyltransferase family protein [Desulfobulbaceae bacterium]|nr:lysophospholipid acyltransferase family protein [Desulfobulbaceae bacterium]